MTNQMHERIYATAYPHCEWRDTEKQAKHIADLYNSCKVTEYIRADLAQKTVTRYLINAYEKNRPVSSAISALIASGIVKVHP